MPITRRSRNSYKAERGTGSVCIREVPGLGWMMLETFPAAATEQVINEGKPAQIAEKIVNGKMGKYYKENCLVDQLFVKDGDYTVAKYTDKIGKDLGGKIEIVSFVRYEKGEGLEKRSDNFADEVASMIK